MDTSDPISVNSFPFEHVSQEEIDRFCSPSEGAVSGRFSSSTPNIEQSDWHTFPLPSGPYMNHENNGLVVDDPREGKLFLCRMNILGVFKDLKMKGGRLTMIGQSMAGGPWQSVNPRMLTGKAIIHVNRQFIAMNAKDGGNRPVFTTKVGSKHTIYARSLDIIGRTRLVSPGEQLKCGARAWIEADVQNIRFTDPMDFESAKSCVEGF
jgi:hypothetical protein